METGLLKRVLNLIREYCLQTAFQMASMYAVDFLLLQQLIFNILVFKTTNWFRRLTCMAKCQISTHMQNVFLYCITVSFVLSLCSLESQNYKLYGKK